MTITKRTKMKWLKVLPPHIIALSAVIIIAFNANSNYEWYSYHALYLLPVTALFVTLRYFSKGRIGLLRAAINTTPNEDNSLGYYSNFWITELPHALRTFAIGMLVIALARPQSSDSVEDMTSEGIDLVLAIDVSHSMLSQDFKPNRLERSKIVAMEFIDARPHDRIGVVAYEGEAFTQVPVTSDHVVVKNGIMALQPGLLEGGTAIGMGLATAVNRLRNSQAESRVIILLTDGMNNAGQIDPSDAAQLAELNNIRIYTIGVGTIGKAKSPVAFSGKGYKYDWVDVKIDEDVLMDIADRTGGKYFRATNAEKLSNIYGEIDELEKTRFNVIKYQRKTEAYLPFVLMALISLLLERTLRFTLIRSLS